jgi:hypothetical protein
MAQCLINLAQGLFKKGKMRTYIVLSKREMTNVYKMFTFGNQKKEFA